MPKVCFSGGGTGGHIYPGLAVVAELQKQRVEVFWIGSNREQENKILQNCNFKHYALNTGSWYGKKWLRRVAGMVRLVRAIIQARKLILQEQPQVVIALGGFASLPTAVVAILQRRPLLLLEQNTVAGLSNRLLSFFACATYCAFPRVAGLFHTKYCGNPLRNQIVKIAKPQQRFSRRPAKLRIAILGGSQGALALNRVVPQALAVLPNKHLELLQIKHQCGKQIAAVRRNYLQLNTLQAEVQEYWDNPEDVYGWADLLICRAGAMTVSEVMAVGVAALFIPYEYAARNHQLHNAEHLSAKHAAWICPAPDFNHHWLSNWLEILLTNGVEQSRKQLLTMATRARCLAKREATQIITRDIIKLIK